MVQGLGSEAMELRKATFALSLLEMTKVVWAAFAKQPVIGWWVVLMVIAGKEKGSDIFTLVGAVGEV
jgi:hypothetical protein